MSTAIEFNHVGKQYRLGLVSTRTLSHDINRWWQMAILKKEDPYLKIGETNDRTKAGSSEYVWALRDIDFKVEQGDVVGIIGKNGAGKSTLLKLLSKVTGPTVGTIRARGRIGALLEVGTGFHPEMTGRENIYMNGAIMGMSKAEVSRKLDEIIDFSGCERYIDTPVKRYSSGMTVRLGFAVAAHLDPDILVVDEVLAVGDAEFQKKAIGKMQSVSQGEGRTVLFVSHNMENVKNLCKTGVIMENGRSVYRGDIVDCVNRYLDLEKDVFLTETVISDKYRKFIHYKQMEVLNVKLLNESPHLALDEESAVEVTIRRNEASKTRCTLEMMIDDVMQRRVGSYISEVLEVEKDLFTVVMKLRSHNLAKGKYYINFNLGLKEKEFQYSDFDIVYGVLSFEIAYLRNNGEHEPIQLWKDSWGRCQFHDATVEMR